MPVPRIYRLEEPPAPITWTALDAFHDIEVYREIALQINSVRDFCGASDIDWTAVIAPPNGDRMTDDSGAPLEGWPSNHYFGAALFRYATALLGVDLVQYSGTYVWESPATWATEEPAPYLLPAEFYALFDPSYLLGFGPAFTDRTKWKNTLEVLRGVLGDLQVMFNAGFRIKDVEGDTYTAYTQTPIVSNESWTFTRYTPLQTRYCKADGVTKARTFTPTPYANSIDTQYIVTEGAPAGTSTGLETSESGDTLTRTVYCDSVGSDVGANFRYINYTDAPVDSDTATAPSMNSGVLMSLYGDSQYPIVYSASLAKRVAQAIENYEDGQAVAYPAYVFPDMTDAERASFRTVPALFGGRFEPDATNRLETQAEARVILRGTAWDQVTYTLEYYSIPSADRDIAVVLSYPYTATRALTAGEESALAVTVNYTIDGGVAYTQVLYPGDTVTNTHTKFISTAEIEVVAWVDSPADAIEAGAGLWNRSGLDKTYLSTVFWTSTGTTVRINNELYTIVAQTDSRSGDRFDRVALDKPLITEAAVTFTPIPRAT